MKYILTSLLVVLSLVACSTPTSMVNANTVIHNYSTPVSEFDPENHPRMLDIGREPPNMRGMLWAHNKVRNRLGLYSLSWSNELTNYARSWAGFLASHNGCRMKHRSKAGMDPKGYGENIFWASPIRWSDGVRERQDVTVEEVVKAWVEEVKDYSYSSNSCRRGKLCGHYTQVVWRATTQVGCGMAFCPDGGQIWVCSYNPPGNWVGERPY